VVEEERSKSTDLFEASKAFRTETKKAKQEVSGKTELFKKRSDT
jgi:hypothetical protein